MKLTTKTPDWTYYYAIQRRRRRLHKAWHYFTNALCLVGALTLCYFALVICSILEPIR